MAMEPRSRAGFRFHRPLLVSGLRTLWPFQRSSATRANPEMRCTSRAIVQSGEPPMSPRKPVNREWPPTVRIKTLAQECAISPSQVKLQTALRPLGPGSFVAETTWRRRKPRSHKTSLNRNTKVPDLSSLVVLDGLRPTTRVVSGEDARQAEESSLQPFSRVLQFLTGLRCCLLALGWTPSSTSPDPSKGTSIKERVSRSVPSKCSRTPLPTCVA